MPSTLLIAIYKHCDISSAGMKDEPAEAAGKQEQ
jgi:hypothetical protein